jgi:hypothetical protein
MDLSLFLGAIVTCFSTKMVVIGFLSLPRVVSSFISKGHQHNLKEENHQTALILAH